MTSFYFATAHKWPDKQFAQTIAHGLIPKGGYIEIDANYYPLPICVTAGNGTGHVFLNVPERFNLEVITMEEK